MSLAATRGWEPPLTERDEPTLRMNLRWLRQESRKARKRRRRAARMLYLRMIREVEAELARRKAAAGSAGNPPRSTPTGSDPDSHTPTHEKGTANSIVQPSPTNSGAE